jgi:hypothetical protein
MEFVTVLPTPKKMVSCDDLPLGDRHPLIPRQHLQSESVSQQTLELGLPDGLSYPSQSQQTRVEMEWQRLTPHLKKGHHTSKGK